MTHRASFIHPMPPTYNLQLDRLAVDRDGAKAKVDTDCANAAVLKLVVLGVGRPAKEQTNKTYVLSQQTQGNGHNTRYLKAYHKSEQEAALSNARVANQDELVHEITGSMREQKRATRGIGTDFCFLYPSLSNCSGPVQIMARALPTH